MMKKVIKNIIINLFGENFFRLYIYGLKVKINRIFRYKILPQKTNLRYETLSFGSDKYHTFFGYYDISPMNKKGLILSNQTPLINKSPDSYMEMRVGYYQINNNKTFNEIGSTTTWCWQQGCRLQWHNDIKVIYNKIVDGDLGCIIQNIDTKEIISKINYPIYSVAKDENWGLTLNFHRLNKYRPGYGYSLPKTRWKSIDIKNDGIWKVDFENNCSNLIVPLEKIIEVDYSSEMDGAKHYINHIQINPSNKRFLFFHLWILNNKRYSRLITANTDGENLFPLINEGFVSHYNWISDSRIIAYSGHKNTGNYYHVYEDMSNNYYPLRYKELLDDGHPTITKNGKYLLTDTYPDKASDQNLILFDLENNKRLMISKYFSPLKFRGEFRCDLHPRFDSDEKYVCFDSANTGRRKLYVMQLNDLINKTIND